MKKSNILSLVYVAVLSVVVSCTGVNVDYSGDLHDEIQVGFSLAWPDNEDGKTENVTVAMSRIVNTVHYVWSVGSDGTFNVSETEDKPDDQGSSGNYSILSGDYYAMAFSDLDSCYDYQELEVFSEDLSISMRDIHAVLKTLSEEELFQEKDGDMTDFNPSFPYIRTSPAFFLDVKKQTIKPEATHEMVFDMKRQTQELVFRIRLQQDPEVEIKGIRGEIAGVPSKIQLMSGLVRPEELGRVVFGFQKVDTEGDVSIYEGKINALGLFPGINSKYITGAGVMQLSVKAASGDRVRLFHAGINLSDTIMESGLMEEADNGAGYRIARTQSVIVVPQYLFIGKDQIVPGEGSQGFEIWFDSEDIDVEI